MDAKGRQVEWPVENVESWVTNLLESNEFTIFVAYRGSYVLNVRNLPLHIPQGKW